jgi:putative MATE family efflux protein
MKKNSEINMTRGPLLPELLQFVLPLTFSSLLQIAFNAADLIVVGHFGRPYAMAAVGANTALINLIITVLLGLATGGGVLCSRYYGARLEDMVRTTVSSTIVVGLIGGVITGVVGLCLAVPLLELSGSPDEVLPLAAVYLRIYFIGLPAMALYNFAASALRSLGNTKQPLIYLIVAGIINVILNLFFVIVIGIDVAGVAIATVISQCVSGVLTLRFLLRSQDMKLSDIKLSRSMFTRILKIGIPAGLQGALFSLSNFIIQASVNSFGAAAIAGASASASVEAMLYCPQDAVMQAATTAVSQNVGAQNYDRTRKVCRESLFLGFVITGLMCALAVVFRREVLGLYTSDEAELEYAMARLLILGTTNVLDLVMTVLSGVNRGLGYSLLPAIVTFVGACLLRIVWVYTVFAAVHTLEILYISYPITWTITALAHLVCYFIIRKRPFRKTLAKAAEAANA